MARLNKTACLIKIVTPKKQSICILWLHNAALSYNRIQISWNISMNNSKNGSTMALPFITYQEGQGFSLSKEAEEFLMALP